VTATTAGWKVQKVKSNRKVDAMKTIQIKPVLRERLECPECGGSGWYAIGLLAFRISGYITPTIVFDLSCKDCGEKFIAEIGG